MLRANFNKNRGLEANSWGERLWYLNGLSHRENGPAYEGRRGYKEWWLDGIQYTKFRHNAELIKRGLK